MMVFRRDNLTTSNVDRITASEIQDTGSSSLD